jgi:cyclopropane fatty-acyl-phospholipid synthase-like methyltransferase
MTLMDAQGFEALYREQIDPWGYHSSEYERDKYRATVEACGPGPFTAALELGGSIGVFTGLLAPRCDALISLDAAPTAVAAARAHLARIQLADRADIRLGTIPASVPDGPFDLVVASEILYYVPDPQLAETLTRLGQCLNVGGRLVAVHWRPEGPERPHTAAQVHDRLRACRWLSLTAEHPTDEYLLDVFTRR